MRIPPTTPPSQTYFNSNEGPIEPAIITLNRITNEIQTFLNYGNSVPATLSTELTQAKNYFDSVVSDTQDRTDVDNQINNLKNLISNSNPNARAACSALGTTLLHLMTKYSGR